MKHDKTKLYTCLSYLSYCYQKNIWQWQLRKLMFRVLVQTVALYACPAWSPGLAKHQWKKLEQVQKRFLLEELGAKTQTPYEMLLAECGMYPLEVEALSQSLVYYMRIREMNAERLPYQALKESEKQVLSGWYEHLQEWARHWGIDIDELPDTEIGTRLLIAEKAQLQLWPCNELGTKRDFYRKEINPMIIYGEQEYMRSGICRKNRKLVSQLRLSLHGLEIEVGRSYGMPRELRYCPCCLEALVEDEQHALLLCSAFGLIRQQHGICGSTLDNLLYLTPRQLGAYLQDFWRERKEILDLYTLGAEMEVQSLST